MGLTWSLSRGAIIYFRRDAGRDARRRGCTCAVCRRLLGWAVFERPLARRTPWCAGLYAVPTRPRRAYVAHAGLPVACAARPPVGNASAAARIDVAIETARS